jgi:hypothetical protein
LRAFTQNLESNRSVAVIFHPHHEVARHCRGDLRDEAATKEVQRFVEQFIVSRFPEEARELLEEADHLEILKEAKESESEENSPPRKETSLFHESKIPASLTSNP